MAATWNDSVTLWDDGIRTWDDTGGAVIAAHDQIIDLLGYTSYYTTTTGATDMISSFL